MTDGRNDGRTRKSNITPLYQSVVYNKHTCKELLIFLPRITFVLFWSETGTAVFKALQIFRYSDLVKTKNSFPEVNMVSC